MKRLITILILFLYFEGKSQVLFSNVYKVPEDKTGQTNYFPNWLSSLFPTDSLIFAFGYSADTTYKDIFGTAFYVFDWSGDLLDYYHIKDDSLHNFFYPEGIYTWDGITFYVGFNHFNKQQSILKFNRLTKQQEIIEISNSIYPGGSIVYSNMSVDKKGYLITASKVETGIPLQWRKVQVSKVDSSGKIIFQKIIGKEPITEFDNIPHSTYIDRESNIYIGIGYTSYFNLGAPGEYESLLYKLDSLGNVIKIYNSQRKQGFCFIYDIIQDNRDWFYLCSDYNYNKPKYPYANKGYGIIQVLDSSMNYNHSISLEFEREGIGPAYFNSLEKIIQSNSKDGFIVGGSVPITRDTIISYIDSLNYSDSIKGNHFLLNLVKINSLSKIEWRRIYRVRTGKDDGYLYDLKSCPSGGYIIAAASYLDDAREKYGDPYYMPWLLRVDDDGCLIPGCNIVNSKEAESNSDLNIYPNPAKNYIILLHSSSEKTRYQVISTEGKIVDDFYSVLQDEQLIIPIHNWKPGLYYIKAQNQSGHISSKEFIKN